MTQGTQQKALVMLVSEVIEGKANPAELEVALVIARQGLESMQEEWEETVDNLPPEAQEKCEDIIEQIHTTFGLFKHGLDLLGVAVDNRRTEELFQGGELVRRCSHQLDVQFSMYRNLALLAQGPTDIPSLNLLIRTLEQVRSNQTQMQTFLSVVNAERLTTLKALDDLAGAPEEGEYGAVRRAFDDHLRCMNRLARAIEANDDYLVDEEMKKAEKTFRYLQELIPLASLRARTSGPTKSQLVNLVIHMAYDVAQGACHQDLLAEHLERLKKDILPLATAVKAAAPVASVMMQQEATRAVAALKGYEEAILGFEQFFETRDVLLLQAASNRLRESADELHACWETLQNLADREGKVCCLRCNFYNSPDRRNCAKCGGALPILVEKSVSTSTFSVESEGVRPAAEEPVSSSNLERMYKAVDAIRTKSISKDEFESELTWFEGLIDQQEKSVGQAPETNLEGLSDEEREEAVKRAELVRETEQAFQGGIQDWREAIQEWRNYLDTGQRELRLLEHGKELCDQGARKLLSLALASQAAAGAGESN